MSSKISIVNSDNFSSEVLSSKTPVLLQFSTPWCAPCRTFAPILESLAEEYSGHVKMCKIDAESNYDLAAKYNINSVPTVIFFKDGQPVDKAIGLLSKQAVSDKIDGMIKTG